MYNPKSRTDRCLVILFYVDKKCANEAKDIFEKCKGDYQYEIIFHNIVDKWIDDPEFKHKILCLCADDENDFHLLKSEWEKKLKYKNEYVTCCASKTNAVKLQNYLGCLYAVDLSSNDHGESQCKNILKVCVDTPQMIGHGNNLQRSFKAST